MWPRFLSVLSKRTGVLVFTTAGRCMGEDAARRAIDVDAQPLFDSYATEGFGYAEYRSIPGYGFALAKPSWVFDLLEPLSLHVLHFAEGAWGAQQDGGSVVAVRRSCPPRDEQSDAVAGEPG
jgi:hypothetical protein